MTELKKIMLTAITSSLLTALVFIINTPAPAPATLATNTPTLPDNPADSQAANTSLAALLETEREARRALEYEIEWLRTMLDASTGALEPDDTLITAANKTEPWFDDNALLSLDISAADVAYIKEIFNKAEMDKLYLRDQAVRKGRPPGRQFMQGIREIQQNLQQQLGPENYDRMLYASGQTNRIEITDTLPTSPAATAGIRPGDQIISYAGERIYSPRTLVQATTQGEAGELISVEILRNNEPVTVYLPRGPIGARLKPIRSKPG